MSIDDEQFDAENLPSLPAGELLDHLREQIPEPSSKARKRNAPNVGSIQTASRLAVAEWADPQDFADRRPYEDGDFWLCRSPLGGVPLGYDDDRHALLCCGTRGGKGVSTILPQHLLWPGSLVSVDPTGENATIAAARRGQGNDVCIGMGQKVYVLDPMNAASVADEYRKQFNPLDALDPDEPKFIEKAGALADAIVIRPADERDPIWNNKARTLIKALVLHIKTDPLFEGRRTLQTLHELATMGDRFTYNILKEAGDEDIPDPFKLLFGRMKNNRACGNAIPAVGNEFLNLLIKKVDKQWSGVMASLVNHLEFLESPQIQKCVERSDLSLSELKADPKGISLFLCLPEGDMPLYNRWLRMLINLITYEVRGSVAKPASKHSVFMCLDEFAGLEHMKELEQGIASLAKYGLKILIVLQDLGQLKSKYKDNWQTFLTNTSIKLFYSVHDEFTAEFVSKWIGETDLSLYAETRGHSLNEQLSQGVSQSSTTGKGGSRSHTDTSGSSTSETHGRSSSQTYGSNISNTDGRNSSTSIGSGTSDSRGGGSNQSTSKNSSRSEGWNPPRLFFRNTTEFLPFLRDGETAGKQTGHSSTTGSNTSWTRGTSQNFTRNQGHNQSRTLGSNQSYTTGSNYSKSETTQRSQSDTTGENWSESETLGRNQSHTQGSGQTFGVNQAFHKRPLIYHNEISLYFSRLEEDEFCFPGLGLLLISGERPMVVQRTNYYEDPMFDGLWDAHPGHPDTAPDDLVRMMPITINAAEAGNAWTDRFGPALSHWHVKVGDLVEKGDPIAEVFPGPTMDGAVDTTLPLYAPVSGRIFSLDLKEGQAWQPNTSLGTIRYHLKTYRDEIDDLFDDEIAAYNQGEHREIAKLNAWREEQARIADAEAQAELERLEIETKQRQRDNERRRQERIEQGRETAENNYVERMAMVKRRRQTKDLIYKKNNWVLHLLGNGGAVFSILCGLAFWAWCIMNTGSIVLWVLAVVPAFLVFAAIFWPFSIAYGIMHKRIRKQRDREWAEEDRHLIVPELTDEEMQYLPREKHSTPYS